MKVLVLGGTSFVGRAMVEDLLAGGHELTLFTRGLTHADLFPQVERRHGDRDTGDYGSLAGGAWDAVVDVSAYVPRHVNQALNAVDGTGRYLFISTGSVYDRTAAPAADMTEDAPRLAPYRDSEQIDGDTYGPLKVACEDDVVSRLGTRATIVRPGIVAGPHDTTDRFTYWARRAAAGGTVALPGRPDQPVQVVDSRDLAHLVTQLLQQDRTGFFNAVGPALPVTLSELISTCAEPAGTKIDLAQVDDVPGFPLVLADPSWDPMFRRSAAAAHAAGMPRTSLLQTAADVLAWDRERGLPPLAVGWTLEEERTALLGA